MAIIKCIECGKEFSDRAKACPNCGCPTSEMTGNKEEINVSITLPIYGPSSEEATKQMKEAVSEAKRTASYADSEFDGENSRIQMMASRSIGLFDNDAVSRVADISMAAKKACDDLYAALQMALLTLDRTCRPLLSSKPDGAAVREVYYEIKQLNSDSEIENNFTASFNYRDLGDVATRRYSPSLEAKMIENFWRTEFDKIKSEMDKVEADKRAKELEIKKQAEEKKKKELEEFQAANKTKIDEYDKKAKQSYSLLSSLEDQAFEKKREEITKNREKEKSEVDSRISKSAEIQTAAIQKERSDVDKTYVEDVTTLRAALEAKKSTLASLGMFKFSEKKTLSGEIENLVHQLQSTTETYKKKASSFEGKLKNIEEEKKKTLQKEFSAIETRFPVPVKVQQEKTEQKAVIQQEQKTAVQVANEGFKEAIYEYLSDGELHTISDVMENCPVACDLSNQRVSALIRQLVTDGRVERVEQKRLAYFRAYETSSKKKGSSEKKKGLPEKKNLSGALEDLIKNKPVSFSQLNVADNKGAAMEEYEKYGYLKFMAKDKKIYCEEDSKDLTIYYIPEEYRKMN